ncbi:tripartite tricarboxylate transporter substrate-binding protein [Ensifer sp. MJa1]|uniref:tripartite tricarboxylate transporter substrate-binding protein n=1 Tax=Ensifer sp. MJa1 TaxID=2919888 RepID=UPI0030086010
MKPFNSKALLNIAAAAALSAVSFLAPVSARADEVEDFYKGKLVTFLVSAPAGSLTDLVARSFVEHFRSHMAGNPNVAVLNLPGAGGMMAAAQLQLKEPNDGTVIGFLQRNNLYVPLIEGEETGFDPRELEWLGSLEKVAYAMIATDKSEVQTTEELFEKPLILGATGFSNENRTLTAMLNDMIGTKFKIIHGYDARGEVYLAMERGEVDGWASTVAGLSVPDTKQMLDQGRLKVLLHLGFESPAPFENVPNLSAYLTKPEDKELYSFFTRSMEAGRPIGVPKGVPEDRLAALRKAFDEAAADPDFIAAMKERDYPVEAINGAAVEQVVKDLYATSEATLAKVRAVTTAEEQN